MKRKVLRSVIQTKLNLKLGYILEFEISSKVREVLTNK